MAGSEQTDMTPDARKSTKRCQHPGCETWPSFNYEGKLSGAYCAAHKLEGMVINRKKRCAHPDCNKRPSFNKPGQPGVRYCAAHKEEGMVDVHKAACSHPGCLTWPSFRDPENPRKRYCNKHKQEGMICRQGCAHPGCTRWPAFHFPGERKRQFCSEHKQDGMIDTKHRRCGVDGCVKKPSFNFVGQPALRCKDHMEEGMVNVLSKQCAASQCQKRPNFNSAGASEALFCASHAGDGMVNLSLSKKVNTGVRAAASEAVAALTAANGVAPQPGAMAAALAGPSSQQLAAGMQMAAAAGAPAEPNGMHVSYATLALHAAGGNGLGTWDSLAHAQAQLAMRQQTQQSGGGLAALALQYMPAPSEADGMHLPPSALLQAEMQSGSGDMQFMGLAAPDHNQGHLQHYQLQQQDQLVSHGPAAEQQAQPEAEELPSSADQHLASSSAHYQHATEHLLHPPGCQPPQHEPQPQPAPEQAAVPAVFESSLPSQPAQQGLQFLDLPLHGMRPVEPPAQPISLVGMY